MTTVYSQLQLARAASNTFVEWVARAERASWLERKVPARLSLIAVRCCSTQEPSSPAETVILTRSGSICGCSFQPRHGNLVAAIPRFDVLCIAK